MSDQERDKLMKATEDAEESAEDVEAHVKGTKSAADDDSDDVKAHVKGTKSAADDDSDDVEAHVKLGRQ
jgi:hypothetical protein